MILVLLAVVAAYAAGWTADAWLNDEACIGIGRETDRIEYVVRRFPARTDCRVTSASGAVVIHRGSPEVFWAASIATLVSFLALLAAIGLAWRAIVVVLACLVALAVIFA